MTRYLLAIAILAASAAPAAATAPSIRIDDFEDLDLEAAPGLSWTAIGDWLIGGTSSGAIAAVRPSAGNRSHGALRLDGHLRDGTKHPFAGVWTALRGDGVPCDLAGYSGLRLRVRGTPGRYQAGVRRMDGKASGNYMAPIEVTAAWTSAMVRFADLARSAPVLAQSTPAAEPTAFAPRGITWLGITTGEESPRDFTLEIDDVELVAETPPDPGLSPTQKLMLTDPRSLDRLAFTTIARDDRGDTVHPRLPDARELQLAVDPSDDRVWFRFVLQDPPPDGWFGLNVALDIDGDPDNGGAWWGQNKRFHYDRLITAYLGRGAGYWQGFVGVADAAQVASFSVAARSSDVRVAVDPARKTLAVGVPRVALGLAPGGRARLIGTVGSNLTFNDDVPAEGAIDVTIPEPAHPAPH
ncbi:MAG TPA: CIA30 family protein [Kofleriaceae bacterium]